MAVSALALLRQQLLLELQLCERVAVHLAKPEGPDLSLRQPHPLPVRHRWLPVELLPQWRPQLFGVRPEQRARSELPGHSCPLCRQLLHHAYVV